MTNIHFNNKELQLLSKGLKHNIETERNVKHTKNKLLDIENTIAKTAQQHQDDIRTLFVGEITKRMRKPTITTMNKANCTHVINEIKTKLCDNNAIITKADKGNTIVIMKKDEYNTKIEQYINDNNIKKLNTDPTKAYLRNINSVINRSTSILTKNQIHNCKTIKPEAPTITGLPKIHKDTVPIRPLINFTTSPTYKIARILNKWLTSHIDLEPNFSVRNNLELVDKIKIIDIPRNAKLASFDISNMYTNIPVEETLRITQNLLKHNKVPNDEIKEAMDLLRTITQQNYFIHNNNIFTQTDGLPMGSPLSGTLANIYINYIEKEHIINNKNRYKQNIIYWHRYVDDILILFNGTNRQLEKLHQYINNIHSNIKFTIELETGKQINFLDLTIQNINNIHNFKIYRKPTQTDHTIHCTSNHPFQHKISAYNHMLNRLNHIPMHNTNYMEELNTIKQIAQANGYPEKLIITLNKKIKYKINHQHLTTLKTDDTNVKKYVPTIYDPQTSYALAKICNRFGYTVAHKTKNTLQHVFSEKYGNQLESGVYKLVCNECHKFYIGQTGRSFKQRFQEHVYELSNTTRSTFKSNYAQHIHDEKHTYTDMQTNLQIVRRMRKSNMLDRVEELEIYRERNNPHLLNDKTNTKTNKLYELILHNRRII